VANLSALIKGYKGDLARVHRDSILELGNRVVDGTPFKDGRARGGWSHSGPIQLGVIHSFTNNVEYIIPLEYGHSKLQAPQGMLRINVRNWNSIVQEQI